MNKISFILTTLNEETHIYEILNTIRNEVESYEIIIIDDQSSDNTINIINSFNDINIKVYIRDFNSGLGSAIVSGIFLSTGDILCWVDVSMSYVIKKIINESGSLEKYDITIFSRYIKDGGDLRNYKRKIPSILINKFARLILTKKITDYTGGLFIFNRKLLQNIFPLAIGHGNYFIDFIYRCHLMNLKINQVPIVYKKDVLVEKSKTFKSIISFLILGIRYLITIIIVRIKKYIKI